jgi:hypothetical protein
MLPSPLATLVAGQPGAGPDVQVDPVLDGLAHRETSAMRTPVLASHRRTITLRSK